MDASYTCPCCGFNGLTEKPYMALPSPPWHEEAHGAPPYCCKYGTASYEVCACCGFEFGNDDEPGTADATTFQEYRTEWIAEGCHWFDPDKKHASWNLGDQLTAAGLPFQKRPENKPAHPTAGNVPI